MFCLLCTIFFQKQHLEIDQNRSQSTKLPVRVVLLELNKLTILFTSCVFSFCFPLSTLPPHLLQHPYFSNLQFNTAPPHILLIDPNSSWCNLFFMLFLFDFFVLLLLCMIFFQKQHLEIDQNRNQSTKLPVRVVLLELNKLTMSTPPPWDGMKWRKEDMEIFRSIKTPLT